MTPLSIGLKLLKNKPSATEVMFLGEQGAQRLGMMPDQSFLGPEGKPRFEITDAPAKILSLPAKGESSNLGDILSHPQLFEAYPDLSGIPVRNDPELGYGGGAYTPKFEYSHDPGKFSQEKIGFSKSPFDSDTIGTLLHEIQHAIQSREGFKQGGSIGEFYEALARLNLSKTDPGISSDYNRFYKNATGEREAYDVSKRYRDMLANKLLGVPALMPDPEGNPNFQGPVQ